MSAKEQRTAQLLPDFDTRVTIGAIPNVRRFSKFGYNPDIDAGIEDVWNNGGRQVWITTASAGPALIASTAAADTSAGTGMRTLTIQGLNAAWASIESTVTLQGTTTVTTSASFFRINRAFGVTAGVSAVNSGAITGRIGGDIQFFISSADGQTQKGNFSVAAGKYVIVREINVSFGKETAGDQAIYQPQQMRWGQGESCWRSLAGFTGYQGTQDMLPYFLLYPKTDVRQQVDSDFTNLEVSTNWYGYEIDTTCELWPGGLGP